MNAVSRMESWVRICRVDDIPVLGARVVERSANDGNIAVFRNGEDRVFALLDRCPHKGGPLSQGIVFGDRVACPLHGWAIQLGDGCASAPDVGCTQRFAVNVDEGDVYLDASALMAPSPGSTPASAAGSASATIASPPSAAHDRSATDQRDGRV